MFDSCLAEAQDRIECFVNASVINNMPASFCLPFNFFSRCLFAFYFVLFLFVCLGFCLFVLFCFVVVVVVCFVVVVVVCQGHIKQHGQVCFC